LNIGRNRSGSSPRRHAVLVLGSFLAYEALLIAGLALLWNEGPLVAYAICALALAGYAACGLTGKPWSAACLALPLPLAWVASAWFLEGSGAVSASDEWSLSSIWFIWTLALFLPAWAGCWFLGSVARATES